LIFNFSLPANAAGSTGRTWDYKYIRSHDIHRPKRIFYSRCRHPGFSDEHGGGASDAILEKHLQGTHPHIPRIHDTAGVRDEYNSFLTDGEKGKYSLAILTAVYLSVVNEV